jgi:hypothetical protein
VIPDSEETKEHALSEILKTATGKMNGGSAQAAGSA